MEDEKKISSEFSLTSSFTSKLYASIVLFLLYVIKVFSLLYDSFHFPLFSWV